MTNFKPSAPKSKIAKQSAKLNALNDLDFRIELVKWTFVVVFSILVIRLFSLILTHDENLSNFSATLAKREFVRGNIIDRNGELLATNLRTASLFANCKKIQEPKLVARKLSKILPNVKYKEVLAKLNSGKNFIWLKRNLTPKQQYLVNNLGFPGLDFEFEEKRIYPHSHLLSHVLGYVGVDGSGLAGFEKFHDEKIKNSTDPIQLTIDIRVQNFMHKELTKIVKEHEAKGAVGVLMDANNGDIIALSSLPDFNPHHPNKSKGEAKFNKAVQGVYEMGSSFKPFTMAMAIESKVTDLNDVYYVGKPIRAGGKFMISDFHSKGKWLSVPEIFLYSSNIGMSKINLSLGPQLQKEYLKIFGFLDAICLPLQEKAKPIFPQTEHWSDLSIMTISYGYGIAVTPVHMVKAFASLVNGGLMHEPKLLKNDEIKSKRVISEETSEKMRKLLRLVVRKGTGRKIGAPGYVVGGKTGTANKSDGGSYDQSSRFTTFLSSFPMNNPQYVMLVMVDDPKPQKNQFGFATAAYNAVPATGRIIKKIAPLLSISRNDNIDILLDEELVFKHDEIESLARGL